MFKTSANTSDIFIAILADMLDQVLTLKLTSKLILQFVFTKIVIRVWLVFASFDVSSWDVI